MTESKKREETIGAETECISIARLFIIWLRIGATSFGGGAVTQYLIQEDFIYKQKLITSDDYANIIAMCQIAPGINILAYTIIIGKRLAGWSGIAVSLLGLILPSALITIGITAVYAHFSEFPRVQSSLRAVFAAIFGVALATNWRTAQPILVKNQKRGLLPLAIALLIMLCSSAIYLCFHPPVLVLYLFGGLSGAFAYVHFSRNHQED